MIRNGKDVLAAPPPEKVTRFHAVRGVATSVSTDGSTCLLKFEIPGGEFLELTFPSTGLPAVRTMFANLMRDLARRMAGAGGVPIRPVQTVQVQRHDGVRNHVILVIDKELPEETAFALPDKVGVQVGTEIRKAALAGLPEEERITAQAMRGSIIIP